MPIAGFLRAQALVFVLAGPALIWFCLLTVQGEMRRGYRYCEAAQSDKKAMALFSLKGGNDVFVHISAVERAGLSTLNEGVIVEYEVVANKGKEAAGNLKVR